MENSKELYDHIKKLVSGEVPTRYDLRIDEIDAILNNSNSKFEIIGLFFKYGFLKGQRYANKQRGEKQ